MKRNILHFFLMLGMISYNNAQTPDVLWQYYYGIEGYDVSCYCMTEASDGGYVLSGFLDLEEEGQLSVFKVDAAGSLQWNVSYGDGGIYWAKAICQAPDGGYVAVGGRIMSEPDSYDVYAIRIDNLGNLIWEQVYETPLTDQSHAVCLTDDNCFIIGGSTDDTDDVFLLKIDSDGELLWSRFYEGISTDHCTSVLQTPDGGFVYAGYSFSVGGGTGYPNAYIIKTDAQGHPEWQQDYGGEWSETCYAVRQLQDGSFILGCSTCSLGAGGMDFWLVKTDPFGEMEWQQTYGGSDGDQCYSLCITADNGYLMGGMTQSYGAGITDFYAVKTDSLGNFEWSYDFGGNVYDACKACLQNPDGEFILAGYVDNLAATDIKMCLICLDSETGVTQLDLPQPLTYSLLPAYPNPFNPSTLIRFEMPIAGEVQIYVYDIQGNVIATLTDGWQMPGSYQVPFNAANLSSGIYLARLTAGDYTQTQKLVLMK